MMNDEYDDGTSSSRESYDDDCNMDSEPEPPTAEEIEANNERIQAECVEKFSTPDFIMEPDIFTQLKRYFQSGGDPEQVINLLSSNYQAIAQTANLLAEWLITAGMTVSQVQAIVENHLQQVIIKHFDPKKADSIFTEEGYTTDWLTEMIGHHTWRTLIYKLAEDHPDCLMLNFTIKLISDNGYQDEIKNISTASQQLEVFSRILKSSVSNFLEGGEEKLRKNADEFTRMVCHGEHTYLYSQALLHVLSRELKGGSNIKRLSQEVNAYVQRKKQNAASLNMTLKGATTVPRACQALVAMLSKNALNPADITVLYKMYQTTAEAPPVELIRVPQFLDLLMESLFKPGSRVSNEHKPKYIFLLAYAVSVHETYRRGLRKSINKEELKTTTQAIEKVHKICNEKKGSSELLPELNTLFQCIRFPIVALGIIRWVDFIVSEKSYFKLSTEHTPLHLVLLDEVSTCHITLHQKVLELLIRLFESSQEDLDVLVQLDMKKMLLDRMVHLFSCGCAISVLSYIKTCWQRQDTDISLIRYFVTEVLDIIAPPYTPEFINLLLPLVENEEITGTMKSEAGDDPVSEFIKQCKSS